MKNWTPPSFVFGLLLIISWTACWLTVPCDNIYNIHVHVIHEWVKIQHYTVCDPGPTQPFTTTLDGRIDRALYSTTLDGRIDHALYSFLRINKKHCGV